MQKMKWVVYPKKSDSIIEQLLINRGIDPKDKDQFLNPDFDRDLLDPFLMDGMDKAVEIVHESIKNREKIGIFADYDADGVPGAALLWHALKLYGVDAETYIPSRDEGYGVNEKGIRELYEKGCKLFISIDLGITSKEQVKLAKKMGMKVIITDHHEIQKKSFPDNADVVIHTHTSKKYINKDLAGGAVVYKLIQALGKKYGVPDARQLKWLLDLPAISTICDMVPLTGENRVITKYGLVVLSKTKNIGLKKLYKEAAIDEKHMDTYTVGFGIGPRINAPGRMDHAQASYFLLTTEEEKEAILIAKKINETNVFRQKSLETVLEKSQKSIVDKKLDQEKIIVVTGKKLPVGVVGLVASRITDRYNRPSIVLSEEDGVLRGSARSIDRFNLVDNLKKTEKYLLGFGGHAKAAGVSLKKENFSHFYKKITEIARQKIKDKDLIKEVKIDAQISSKDLSFGLTRDINSFEPFGLGNPRPVFMLKKMEIDELKWVGREKNHLKLKIKKQGSLKIFDAICFGLDREKIRIRTHDTLDLVFHLNVNVWRGQKRLDLQIIDMKIS